MHGEGFGRHVALGIDMPVKGLASRHAVENLDAADFDQPVTAERIKAGGFGIENDFAHENEPLRRTRTDESRSSRRHLSSLGQNVPNPRPYGIKTMRSIHHEMRAFSFFRVGHLPR